MNVVISALSTIMEKSAGEITLRSSPMLRITSSIRLRVFMSIPSAVHKRWWVYEVSATPGLLVRGILSKSVLPYGIATLRTKPESQRWLRRDFNWCGRPHWGCMTRARTGRRRLSYLGIVLKTKIRREASQ
jgi:hypothetical protein